MTNREIRNLLKMLNEQLHLIRENEQEFMEKEGKRKLEERIDGILDRINFLKNLLKNKENE
jgi:hypothetical protein